MVGGINVVTGGGVSQEYKNLPAGNSEKCIQNRRFLINFESIVLGWRNV